MSSTLLAVYNPLPLALAHYARALVSSMPTVVHEIDAPGVEVGGQGQVVAASRLAQHLRIIGRARLSPLLELWPVLGHWETAALSRRRGPVATVWHDPDPLRNARGHSRAARRLARARGRHVVAVAHSRAAEARLREIGYADVVYVPHPVHLDLSDVRPRQPVARVLGQHKSQRDLQLLRGLAPLLDGIGLQAEVLGRGWPQLDGWATQDTFLSEEAFQDAAATASVVIIPYAKYWQSGVALRALECGTPVVGPGGGHLAEVLGPGWPGLVDPSDLADPAAWAAAAARAVGLPAESMRTALKEHDRAARAALRTLHGRLVDPS